jgi:L-fuconolactonase
MIIDSHQHFWDRSLSQFDHSWQENEGLENICRTFLPEHLKPLIDAAGVDKTVFVQTQHSVEENRWVLELAEQNDWIAGVVGWVDLASPECESQVLEFKQHSKFVGVRHVVQDEPDDDFIIRDDVQRGLGVLEKYGVPYDLLFFVKHLRHAATVAKKFPNLRLVIDHLAKPVIKRGEMDGWRDHFIAAAKHPNVWCKLSGMVTEADWDAWRPDDLKPYVETALEHFGPQRCMFGSDWPVCELAASYQQVFEALVTCIGGVSETERARILGENAIEFYQLDV